MTKASSNRDLCSIKACYYGEKTGMAWLNPPPPPLPPNMIRVKNDCVIVIDIKEIIIRINTWKGENRDWKGRFGEGAASREDMSREWERAGNMWPAPRLLAMATAAYWWAASSALG